MRPRRLRLLLPAARVSSSPRLSFSASLLLSVFSLLVPHLAAAEDEPPPSIWPTTTLETGDRGGTFFGQKPDPQKTHRYFIAAEFVTWDYVPSGSDDVCGLTLPPPVLATRTHQKLRYVQYTDATFRTRALAPRSLGIMGPILRGVTGEFLAVTFLNRTAQSLSLHPHGVRYDKDSEGAYYRPDPGRGAAVAPGARFTYVWHLDDSSGPLPTEPSSRAWLYHSHVLGDTEANLGLVGALIVTDSKRARPDGSPADVDREFATLFMIFDESGLSQPVPLPPNGRPTAAPPPPPPANAPTPDWAKTQQALEAGARATINGYIFGNLPGLEMNEGERTRWYLFGLGSQNDFHTAHWHGLRVVEDGRRRTDVVELLPATMKTADLLADNPGSWLYHCHVADHMREGMFARLTVFPRDAVGIPRDPATSFLGLRSALTSIRLEQAESVLNVTVTPARADIVITGTATVPDTFDTNTTPIRVQFGTRTVELPPTAPGIVRAPRAMLRFVNADETGLVHGGLVQFELTFNGPDWLQGVPPATPGTPRPVPLTLTFGETTHTTTARLTARTVQAGKH
jgi:FtsP/CotA-like multicopper oxidase with cupredoxin domain